MIPDYIREQVLNAKPPDGCCVPGGSVPAVAEGHFTFARAATVGINPHGSWNRKDYLPKECLTLDRDDLDEQFLNRVWEEKTRYFERNTHRYFTMLKPILNVCGVTYGGNNALIDPTWPVLWTWSNGPRILCGASCQGNAQPMLKASCSVTARRSLRKFCKKTRTSNCCLATARPS